MTDSIDPKCWLNRAMLDLRSAANNLHDDPTELAEVICYESHQACEKALKGLLLSKGQTPPHIHDLPALLTACSIYEPALERLRESILQLNDYCVDAHYPGDLSGQLDAGIAESAYRFAQDAIEAIVKLLKE